MKALREFIVHVPKKYNDTWKSESGTEWHLSQFHNKRELANASVEVISSPIKNNKGVEVGDKVLIDIISILDSEQYKFGNTGNHLVIDREKGLYRVEPNLILLYQKKNETEWRSFGDKVIVEKIMEETKPVSSIIIDPTAGKKALKDRATVVIPSESLMSEGVKKGDVVIYDNRTNIDLYLEGNNYMWLKDRNVLACLV